MFWTKSVKKSSYRVHLCKKVGMDQKASQNFQIQGRFGTFCKQPDYWQDQNCKDFWTKGHYRESQKMIRNLVSILSWLSEGLKMIKRRKYKFWGQFGLFGSLESTMHQWGRILIRGQHLIDLCIQRKGIKRWFVTVNYH